LEKQKQGVPGSRTERKKEETRKKIITVTMGLIKSQGFEATSMEQIARETDIAKGTLYNYFPVKEAIIDEYIRRSFHENLEERVRQMLGLPDTRSRMEQIFRELMQGVQANRDFFERYLVYRMQKTLSFRVDDSEKSGFYLIAAKIIELGQSSGEIRTDLPPFMVEDLFEYAFVAAVKQFYLEPEKFVPEKIIAQCVDLFISAVKN